MPSPAAFKPELPLNQFSRINMTRREFLEKIASLSAAVLAGVACAMPGPRNDRAGSGSGGAASNATAPSSSPSTPTARPAPTASPVTVQTATPQAMGVPAALVRDSDVTAMVAKAVRLAGGLAGLQPGATVFIKPNVNSDDPYPATTNPAVVGAVVELVKSYNPKRIVVADRSNGAYDTLHAMQKVGIYQAALAAGAEVLALEREPWTQVRPQGSVYWHTLQVPRLLMEADYVINMPVAHTHFLAGYSLALKNWVGMIALGDRDVLHTTSPSYNPSVKTSPPEDVVHHYGVRAAEANLVRPASFVVLDATRALVTGGPFTGQQARPGIVVACRDLVAADAAGLALLTYFGAWSAVSDVSVWQQPQIVRAIELGLGVRGANEMKLVGEGVRELEDITGIIQS